MADDQRSPRPQRHTEAGRSSPLREPSPVAGIVIPVYAQPMLLAEAVSDALAQSLAPAPHIVIVNDGCRFAETDAIAHGLAILHPDRITYLRRRNGGLSAARNTGIDYLLGRFPDIRAIYMLDADNRLRSDALEAALSVLDAHDDAGWVYPSLSMFGVRAEYDYSGPFSHLMSRQMNPSEAGSLIRAEVFRQGARFDESMRSGYEDWSFFLTCAELGWRGQHLDDFGMLYRKRGESMLAESTRIDSELRGFIRRKHKNAFSLRTLTALEQAEAPRYAVYLADLGVFRLTTDPEHPGETIDAREFTRRYWDAVSAPNRCHFPAFIVATTSAALDGLSRPGLLRGVFWRMESALGLSSVAMLDVREAGEGVMALEGPLWAEEAARAHLSAQIVMIGPAALDEIVADPLSEWADSLTSTRPNPPTQVLRLHMPSRAPGGPFEAPPAGHALGHVLSLLRQAVWRRGTRLPTAYRQPGQMPYRTLHTVARTATGSEAAAVYPAVSCPADRNIGFFLPLVSFGGVEKVAIETARVFRARGWSPHLFVGPAPSLRLPESVRGVFDSFTFVPVDMLGDWDPTSTYLGTPLPGLAQAPGHQSHLLGAIGWLDALVNCHSAGANVIMAQARRAGVITIGHQHVIDVSKTGRPVGHPFLALAFEHAYDHIIACSEQLAAWHVGMGAPPSKMTVAPNASSFPLDPAESARILASRSRRAPDAPLRVLSIGRLDRQKGVDRVLATIAACADAGVPIQWRIVGDAVLDTGAAADELRSHGITTEKAVYGTRALSDLYAWADVVILLSRWEGLPLTLIEAMRVGVAPLATSVGAVNELIRDGVNGRLVDPAGNVPLQAADALQQLAQDRSLLLDLARAAQETAEARNWTASVTPIAEAVEAELARRRG